jgi:23S rRNA (pseudouridine1915-N3)-methyltransferase
LDAAILAEVYVSGTFSFEKLDGRIDRINSWRALQFSYARLVLITLAYIGARPSSGDQFEPLVQMYLQRTSSFARCESAAFRTEEALLEWISKQQARTPAVAVLLDSRGKQMNSEAFAAWLGSRRDEGAQHIVFAIGPASGWGEASRQRARLLLSVGQLTLAHSLARVVMAEQIYRASTILTGHPYHTGH